MSGPDIPQPCNASRIGLTALLLLLVACGGSDQTSQPTAGGEPPRLTVQRTFTALTLVEPVGLLQAPGDDTHWYVIEQRGRILRFPARESVTDADTGIVLDLSAQAHDPADRRVDAGGEKGLLGFAFHPDFPTDPRAFVSYTAVVPGSTQLISVLASLRSSDAGQHFDPQTLEVLLSVEQPFANHNGGHIAFAADGTLFLGLGDGGSGGDPQGNAQNCANLLGGLLRIDVDSLPDPGLAYAIPADNPLFGNQAGLRPELFAWGFRNPWRWSFDRATGSLWLGDVGQGRFEEAGPVRRGENHGWRLREGAHPFSASSPDANCPAAELVDPQVEYAHDGADCSITGGYVYRGSDWPALYGTYLYGDFCSGRLRGLPVDRPDAEPPARLDTGLAIAAFAESHAGELYIVDRRGGIHAVEAH